jgi:hypothetical protein
MESRYNGQLYRFNIFNKQVQSAIPKFNLETNQENPFIEVNGEVIYYEHTTLKNGVKVTVPMKKHHFTEFDDAVKKQLMYFENVVYTVVDEYKNTSVLPVRPVILFEDDSLVISDNKYYSKPHILINNVNYGFINFDELELEQIFGNIGIKVRPEEVEVSPSREALIWEDKTRDAVLTRFKDAQKTASDLISSSIKDETDFVAWLNKVYAITKQWTTDSNSSNAVLATLSKIVSSENLKFQFNHGHVNSLPVELKKDFFKDLEMKLTWVSYTTKNVKGNVVKVIDRSEVVWNFSHTVLVLGGKASNRKDKYLLSLYESFTMVYLPDRYKLENIEVPPKTAVELLEGVEINTKFQKMQQTVIDHFFNSPSVTIYESIEVPKDWSENEEEEEIISLETLTEEEKQASYISAESRRKLNGEILCHVVEFNQWLNQDGYNIGNATYFSKESVPVADINAWRNEEVYWGNEADSGTLKLVAYLLSHYQDQRALKRNFTDNVAVRLFKVAKDNVKYVKDFQHITKFFVQKRGTTITMSAHLIRWNTSRLLVPKMHLLNFMQGLEVIPQYNELTAKYKTLVEYVSKYVDIKESKSAEFLKTAMEDMVNHLDKVYQFQKLVAEGATQEQVATVAQEMWGSTTITDGCAVDMKIISIFEELLDWSSSIRALLNTSAVLNTRKNGANTYQTNGMLQYVTATEEELEAITNYIQLKTT